MSIQKSDITKVLKQITPKNQNINIDDLGWVKNIVVFGEEVVLDLQTPLASLQTRNELKDTIINKLNVSFPNITNTTVHFKTNPSAKPPSPIIKGEKIEGIQNIIAIASGKGGVGKSTVTANIAVSLAQMGFKVGVLDADIYGPSMPLMFNVPLQKPLAVEINGKSMMKPIESYGVKLLSIGFFTKADQAVIWRGPMASKALKQMIFDAHWDQLDFLLVDLPPGTGDIHLSIMQALPITGAVVVSTPQQIALADARRGINMFRQENVDVPILGVIENMAYFVPEELPENKYFIFGKEGAKNLAKDLNVPFIGHIPLVQSIREASDFGRPAALQENSTLAQGFKELSQNLILEVVKRNKNLPPTEIIKITTMAGCSAVKK